MDILRYPRPARYATELAASAEVDCVLFGQVDLVASEMTDCVYGQAPASSLAVDEAAADTLRMITFMLDWQRLGRPKATELALAVEPCAERTALWISGERCLVGLLASPRTDAVFVALAHADAGIEFTRQHRRLGGLGLLYAAEKYQAYGTISPPRGFAELVVDQLALPVVLVDHRGSIRFHNKAAAVASGAAAGLKLVDTRPWAAHPEERERLDAAIAAATLASAPRPSTVRLSSDGDRQAVLCVLPVVLDEPLALVVCGLALPAHPLADAVLESFGLTLAERRLALHLRGGCSVDEAAQAANLKKSTARSYLSRIFDKTGCRRQSELVALFARLVPPLVAGPLAEDGGAGRPPEVGPQVNKIDAERPVPLNGRASG